MTDSLDSAFAFFHDPANRDDELFAFAEEVREGAALGAAVSYDNSFDSGEGEIQVKVERRDGERPVRLTVHGLEWQQARALAGWVLVCEQAGEQVLELPTPPDAPVAEQMHLFDAFGVRGA